MKEKMTMRKIVSFTLGAFALSAASAAIVDFDTAKTVYTLNYPDQLRYAGAQPYSGSVQLTNYLDTAVYSTTNSFIYRIDQDFTTTGDFNQPYGGFMKTGKGTLTFKSTFNLSQPGGNDYKGYPASTRYKRFVLVDDPDKQTDDGKQFFGVMDGTLVFSPASTKTKFTVNQVNCQQPIGAWTADEGEQEPDVTFQIDNGAVAMNTATVIGLNHGYRKYNTPNGPASATLLINGGSFTQAGGQAFFLGVNDTTSAYIEKSATVPYYNTIVNFIMHGGTYSHGTSSTGFLIPGRKGVQANIIMDGGTFSDRNVKVFTQATYTQSSCTIDISKTAVMQAEVFLHNAKGNSSGGPTTTMTIHDGGTFLCDCFTNKIGACSLDLTIDGGRLGNYNCEGNWKDARKLVADSSLVRGIMLGEKGATLLARGAGKTAAYLAVFKPSTALADGVKDGGLVLEGDDGATFEFGAVNTYQGPTTLKGGTLTFSGSGCLPEGTDFTALGGTIEVKDADFVVGDCTLKGVTVKLWPGRRIVVNGALATDTMDHIVFVDANGNELETDAERPFLSVPEANKAVLEDLQLSLRVGSKLRLAGRKVVVGEDGRAVLSVSLKPRSDKADPAPATAAWTGSGADDDLATDGNWLPGKAPVFDGGLTATFAAGGHAVVTDDKPFAGLLFGDLDFAFDAADEYAYLSIGAGGLAFDGLTASHAYGFDVPVFGDSAQSWDVPAQAAVTFDRDVRFNQPLRIDSAGGTVTFLGEDNAFGNVQITNSCVVMSGRIRNLDGVPSDIVEGKTTPPPEDGPTNLVVWGTASSIYPVVFSNAVVEKTCSFRNGVMGGNAFASAAFTTNVFRGGVHMYQPWKNFVLGEGSETIFENGLQMEWSTYLIGGGHMIVRRKPFRAIRSLIGVNDATLTLEVAGNMCKNPLRLEGNTAVLDLSAVDNAFKSTSIEWNGNYTGRIELGGTEQTFDFMLTREKGVITGEPGSRLVIAKGASATTPGIGYTNIACSVEGGVSIEMKGTGLLQLAGRAFASSGDLIASAGTLELAAGARWHNGTNFIARGTGTLRFCGSRPVGKSAVLRLEDDGKVEIADGKCLSVEVCWLDGAKVEDGVYDYETAPDELKKHLAETTGILRVGMRGLSILLR